MPFSSLRDPVDIDRAHGGAFGRAWAKVVEDKITIGAEQSERDRLALIVGLVPICSDEDELVERAIERFERVGLSRDLVSMYPAASDNRAIAGALLSNTRSDGGNELTIVPTPRPTNPAAASSRRGPALPS